MTPAISDHAPSVHALSVHAPSVHSIGHLHQRLRLGGEAAAGPLRARLERLAATELPEAYGRALDDALGDDPAVYVVGEVRLRVVISGRVLDDASLARAWGEGVARAVVGGLGDPLNVRRFENQADYVATFIADLLAGRAWAQWYYGAFNQLRGAPPGEAIGRVLLDNRPHLAEIVARLGRQPEALRAALRAVPPATLHALWAGDGASDAGRAFAEDEARPILLSVMQWAERLGLWRASAPPPAALLATTARAQRLILDWRDPAALALAFATVAHDWLARGWLRPWHGAAGFEAALRPLDWLDLAQLRRALLAEGGGAAVASARREALLGALAEALGRVRLDGGSLDSPTNALLWLSALPAPWADDGYARALIAAFLRAAGQAAAGGAPAAREPWLAALGPAGQRILDTLVAHPPPATRHALPATRHAPPEEEEGFPTRYTGVFLLLRALLDAQLPRLPVAGAAAADWLPAALARHWVGGAADDLTADPGLRLFAMLPEGFTAADLRREIAALDARPLQTTLLRALLGRRLIRGDQLALHRRPLGDGRVALVGEAAAREADAPGVWVFGHIGPSALDDAPVAPPAWLDIWAEVTGRQPVVVAADDASPLSAALDVLAWSPDGAGGAGELTMALTAAALLRLWAYWLGRFAASGVPYLLEQFIRRGGAIAAADHEIRVMLDSRPLDIVLGAAGYLAHLERVERLGGRRVSFGIRGHA